MPFSNHRLSDKLLLDILSHSKEATTVYISEELHIGFVNESMLKLWHKDISILYQRLTDVAPEFASFAPILKHVWENGELYIAEDTPANIDVDGILVERFFDFEYRPVLNEEGSVYAIINTAIDVTERMAAVRNLKSKAAHEEALKEELIASNRKLFKVQEQLSETNIDLQILVDQLTENEEFLQRFIMQAPAGLTLLKGEELVYSILNPKYQELMPGRKLEGRSIFEALPELVGTVVQDMLYNVYHNGASYNMTDSLVPLSEYEYGPTVERYFTFNFTPWKNKEGLIDGVLNLVYEVTDQVKSRQEIANLNDQLYKVNTQLNMATRSARIGTWFIEPETKALTYNTVLAEIFGYEGSEPMTYDQAIAQVMPDYREYLVKEIERAINGGGFYDVIYQQKRFNDDKVIWLRSTGQISRFNDDEVSFSGVVQDISRQRLEEERKDAFIGMVSHELKTPLTSLQGYLQILSGYAAKIQNDFAGNVLEKANKQISKMTRMINGFLNVSRLDSGKIYIDREPFNMVDLLHETEEESRTSFTQNELLFLAETPAFVNADKDKIGQVLTNLISNSVKYSPSGSTIIISCVIDGADVLVTVKDEGIGIAPVDIDKLFDRYYRVESHAMKSIAGFGIGLYLCKEIIEQHKGTIGVNSSPNNGSEFWFRLPLYHPDAD
ncbi:ATP-binding protein [Mucilaginibacter sp. KACC 22063]|uniref:ATP-binding protein n=1 Tax=Mucilaginibacter sp. KACC 22063 TaxID=3025666 RepID=UPI0023663DB5|nr:ATP-binding protein [Mucilaginibacter sp. KACC 22063]WDF53929.1 ATP-binding protein [Mucilaginibacter sp. KACC 22063]